MIVPSHKSSLHADHRQRQKLRVTTSTSLADKYHGLKSLQVNLQFYEADGIRKMTEVKYSVNLRHARSVFLFACPKEDCVEGDFDLSQKLASAVAEHEALASGELCCQGQRRRALKGDACGCHSVLRYTLNLDYRS